MSMLFVFWFCFVFFGWGYLLDFVSISMGYVVAVNFYKNIFLYLAIKLVAWLIIDIF